MLLHNGDCLELLKTLDAESVDAVITDPPYGIFKDTLKYDQLPAPEVWRECYRVAKPNAWLAVFGQMPTMATLHEHITDAGWRYKEHIVWLRRQYVPLPGPLLRGHESILLYSKGNPQMHDTTAPWWDCRLPTLPWGGIDIETLQRTLAELCYRAKHGKWRTKCNAKRMSPNSKTYKCTSFETQFDSVNIGNVWSFWGRDTNRVHPHQKPLALMERLIRLLTAQGDTVLDPFMGVGTTGVACKRLGRAFVGAELIEAFYRTACERIALEHLQPEFCCISNDANP
jgi:site-specific DNA-methyltransferase (adenine-specific)